MVSKLCVHGALRLKPEWQWGFCTQGDRVEAWEHIGAVGVSLNRQEALNILELGLQEVGVYGEVPIIASVSGTAKQILAPSRAGPVSQAPYIVTEAEGPKHVYILQLLGDTDAFLGAPADGCIIVKAGFPGTQRPARRSQSRIAAMCVSLGGASFRATFWLVSISVVRSRQGRRKGNAECAGQRTGMPFPWG